MKIERSISCRMQVIISLKFCTYIAEMLYEILMYFFFFFLYAMSGLYIIGELLIIRELSTHDFSA